MIVWVVYINKLKKKVSLAYLKARKENWKHVFECILNGFLKVNGNFSAFTIEHKEENVLNSLNSLVRASIIRKNLNLIK